MKRYLMNICRPCILLLLLCQHGYGQIDRLNAVETFYSVIPQEVYPGTVKDIGVTRKDLLTINVEELLKLKPTAPVTGGITASNINSGGKVTLSVYYYNKDREKGKGPLLYQCYSDQEGVLTAKGIEYDLDIPQFYWWDDYTTLVAPGRTWNSLDIKRSAIHAVNHVRPVEAPGFQTFERSNIPIIIEVIIDNATLDKFKIPVLGEFDADIFFHQYTETKRRFANPNGYCNYVTYASHRGEKRNYPENSPQAIQEAINLGVDMVEIDLDRTKDGVILGVHLGELGHYVTGKGNLRDSIYETQVKDKLFPIDRLGRPWDGTNGTERTNLAKLEELLLLCRGRVMVHMDKCADYIDKVVAISDKLGMTGDLIFKGTYTPDLLYEEYKGKNILGRIHYSPVLFTDQLNDKAWDPYKEVVNVPGWCTKLSLGSGCTWNQVIDKFLDDNRINTSIDGFELNWFNEFETEETALRAATTHIRDRNKHVIPFPNTPEHYEGWWNKGGKEKPASGNVNDWRRYYPVNDQRANWDMWFDKAANDGKPIPTMIIDDNTIQMMNYLQARGFRNPAPQQCN